MFFVMTVYAKVFPIRAVLRVIPVIPVFVVNSEEVPVLVVKLARALCTDKTVDPQ